MQNNSSNCGIKNFCSIMIICGRNSVVECNLPKVDVEGSSPFVRLFFICKKVIKKDRFRSQLQH